MLNLVTGATGFLGGHLVDALRGRGESVRALVRPSSSSEALARQGVEIAVGALDDPPSLHRAMAGIERVFHCAALVADWGSPEAFEAANVRGVRNLLDAAHTADLQRFVHVSTTDVYGHPDRPCPEDAPFRKRGWPYGDTKIEAEKAVWGGYQQDGLPAVVVRPASIYGPGSESLVGGVADLLRNRSIPYLAGGRAVAGLAYVSNVTDLLLLAADAPEAVGQAYNACDGSSVTWREYLGWLAEAANAPAPTVSIPRAVAYPLGWAMERAWRLARSRNRPLLTRMAVEIFATRQGHPIDKARRELGYQPRVGFEEGMQTVAAWLRERNA